MISIRDQSTPYNGTNFTLSGQINLHPNEDTNVIVSGTWSSDVGLQEAVLSPPYLINLTFQPLATNSSGEYTITAYVRPLDNSPFVIGNNNSASYTLIVRCE